jgi:hypothetical protein
LQIVFGARRLMPRGDPSVDPFGRFERFAAARYLIDGQYIWNLKQHA